MLNQENLLILSFTEDFRKEFSILNDSFRALDKMGGKNCKSCSKNRQKLVLRDMYNKIISEKLTDKYQKFYSEKVSSGGIHAVKQVSQKGGNQNYSKMPLSRSNFINTLLFPKVRELLYQKLGSKYSKLEKAILTNGVHSEEVEIEAKIIYPFIFSKDLFGDFSALLNKLGIIDKVRSTPNSLKVKILESSLALEDEINRFILGKNIVSIQKDRSSALITYR